MCLCRSQRDLPNKSLQMWGFLWQEGTGAQLELTLSSWELPLGSGSQAGLTRSKNPIKRSSAGGLGAAMEMFWLIQVFEKEELPPGRGVGDH